jgi:hypothetical protein
MIDGASPLLHSLILWCSRVQELESIEDKSVDDETKHIWLTNTLQSHREMNSPVRQAITTELTISGIKSKVSTLPWDNFYNMFYSQQNSLTKLLLSQRNSNIKQMQPNKIREAVVMVNRKMVVVVMEVVVVVILMDRMVAPGPLFNTTRILVPK